MMSLIFVFFLVFSTSLYSKNAYVTRTVHIYQECELQITLGFIIQLVATQDFLCSILSPLVKLAGSTLASYK